VQIKNVSEKNIVQHVPIICLLLKSYLVYCWQEKIRCIVFLLILLRLLILC